MPPKVVATVPKLLQEEELQWTHRLHLGHPDLNVDSPHQPCVSSAPALLTFWGKISGDSDAKCSPNKHGDPNSIPRVHVEKPDLVSVLVTFALGETKT